MSTDPAWMYAKSEPRTEGCDWLERRIIALVDAAKAAALHDAAKRLLDTDPLFDSAYDNALVAAYLVEIAEGER